MSSHRSRYVRRRGVVPHPKRTLILRTGIVALMAACGVAASDLASAQTTNASPGSAPGASPGAASGGSPRAEQPPVLLNADQVTFDEQQGIVTASGNVELSQGARSVRADTITYNRNTKVVTASGNIRLLEASGDLIFADYAELTDDLRNAFVDNIRVLMTDNSRLAGNEGERREGRLTRMNRAVYSPCDLCKTDPTRAPLWQIRAVRVVHDNEKKEVRYKDAVMEIFGIPIAYTPYLSHPDPTVDRKSGFLTPSFGNSSELGAFLLSRYYFDITPDQDATLEVGGYSKQGLLVGGQYRKRFEKGLLQLDGSVTRGELNNGPGNSLPRDTRTRGYIAAKGLFDIDPTWRWGFDVQRASDENFLRRYRDYREDVLTSRAFVEGFHGRNYAALNAYSFQDLRYGNTITEPVVFPAARYNALGEPGSLLGGRWSLDSSLLALTRPSDGPNTRRIAVQPGWQREIVSSAGFVTTLSGSVLVAGYTADRFNSADPTVRGNEQADRFRFFPQGQATVRYPFVRYGETSQQLIEPIGQLTVAPNVGNAPVFPNEDSLDVEFDEINLFMPNRFTGIDRLDGGTRVTYGLRGAIHGYNVGSASLFVGQSYRFQDSSDFRGGSGLEDRQSDYVGRLELVPANWLDVSYGFRIDHETLKPRRHSLNASAGVSELRLSAAYTYVDQTENRYAIERNQVEQITLGLSSQFSPHWGLSVAHVQAMQPDPGARTSLAVLTYQDECLIFQTIGRRDYTNSVEGVRDGNTILFRFVFKNIGEVTTPGITGLLGGGGSSSNR